MTVDGKWESMPDTTRDVDDRESFIDGLAEKLGTDKRPLLERLPLEELRYFSWRWDYWPRYTHPRLGEWLLRWDTSAVDRGKAALAEIELCGFSDWRGVRTLDVGCNDGGYLVAAAQKGTLAHGLDVVDHVLIGAVLRRRSWRVPFFPIFGSAAALPYPEETFDAVTCGDVIEHLTDPLAALREIRRVLKPGGYLWLAAPTRYNLNHIRSDPHLHCFGVTLLPPKAAAWYLHRVRRAIDKPENYATERLPTYSRTVSTLRRLGFEILLGEYRLLMSLRDPARIQKRWKRGLVQILTRIGLRLPLRLLLSLSAELRYSIRLVCRKSVG